MISSDQVQKLENLKQKLKKIGLIGTGLFGLTVAFAFMILKIEGITSTVVVVMGIFYVMMVIGLHGWIFLYALLGIMRRQYQGMVYKGEAAIVWGAIIAVVTVGIFIAFMAVPIAILLDQF